MNQHAMEKTEVCARPRDIVNYTVMEMSPLNGGNMWKLRVYQTDRLEEGFVGEKLRDQDFGWINFTRKLGNEDLSFHHFPIFSCL